MHRCVLIVKTTMLSLTNLDVLGPNPCKLNSSICIDIVCTSNQDIKAIKFVASYIPDIIEKKKRVVFGSNDVVDVSRSQEIRVRISSDAIDTSTFKSHELNNVGMISLNATIIEGENTKELHIMNLPIQTFREKNEKYFTRRIFNPFEK